jgi:RNA polymerase sigma-70 factor, ECF subfamily
MSGSTQEDQLMIQRAQQGDRSSFNTLVRKYEQKAYQYAYRLTRNQEEAADIVSEAFLRIYNALHNFRGNSTFNTWLYRILTNCYLDHKKRERLRTHSSLDTAFATSEGEMTLEVEDSRPLPDAQATRELRNERFEDAVLSLPEFQRALIVMYHGENMSYEEMAASLDLPVGTIKSRLNRARLVLRERLVKDEELFQP